MSNIKGKDAICFCALCKGKHVSKYIKRRHTELANTTNEQVLPSKKQCTDKMSHQSFSTQVTDSLQLCTDVTCSTEVEEVCCGEQSSFNSPNHTKQQESATLKHTHMEMLNTSGAACTPLYNGSPHMVLNTLVQYFRWFCEHPGVSKEALSSMLSMQKTILPTPNELPGSYEAALRIIKPHIIGTVRYDICANDCILFRNEYSSLAQCPVCGVARPTGNAGRQFIYLPLKPRLQRLFGNSCMAEVLQSHLPLERREHEMEDIHDSDAWSKAYSSSGIFGGDARGISLALCTDGVNPFAHNRVVYSMWPIMLTLLNLPRRLRNLFTNIMLVGIIPGNEGREAKTLNPFLEVLVDELLEISHSMLYDAYACAPFQAKVSVLLHVLDYPGIGKVMGVVGSGGLQGCAFCTLSGQRSDVLHKTLYMENRRYLPLSSPLRNDTVNFPGHCEEHRAPPQMKCYEEMKDFHIAYDRAPNRTQANLIAKSTGCKGSYALMKLPEHNRLLQTVPDAMHTVKDVIEKLVYLITAKLDDKGKVIRAEEGRFEIDQDEFPPWQLKSCELKIVEERLSHLRVPAYLDVAYQHVFSHPSRLKSHDWKQIACQGILKYCLRDMLGDQQRVTLFTFLDTIAELLSESHNRDALGELEQNLNFALALLERDFPRSIQDITTHLLHHIVGGIRRFGPVYGTWMYAYERFNSWLCKRALNRYRPEATIMETYRIYEWVEFMRLTHDQPSGVVCGHSQHAVAGERQLSAEERIMLATWSPVNVVIPPDMKVRELRRAEKEEKGRLITYTLSPRCYVLTPTKDIGHITSFFNYSTVTYAVLGKLSSKPTIIYGMMHFTHVSDVTVSVAPLSLLSRPLAVAVSDQDLWVLNHTV